MMGEDEREPDDLRLRAGSYLYLLYLRHREQVALQAGLIFPTEKCAKNDSKHVYVF